MTIWGQVYHDPIKTSLSRSDRDNVCHDQTGKVTDYRGGTCGSQQAEYYTAPLPGGRACLLNTSRASADKELNPDLQAAWSTEPIRPHSKAGTKVPNKVIC
jgi:hypothetical protein